ncbi:MAG: hypothetical protein CM1200mP18_04920 [Gammaproteobacteria bacterium]|nr:MAG: hypothetical protein CM1200mP18_04920 [Gammaproteobacteria bacterium]
MRILTLVGGMVDARLHPERREYFDRRSGLRLANMGYETGINLPQLIDVGAWVKVISMIRARTSHESWFIPGRRNRTSGAASVQT